MEGAKLVVEVEAKINNLQTGLNQAGQSVKRFAQESAGFLSSAEQALGRYQKAAFNATDEKQLIFYNKRIQETEQEIKKLTNIGKVGFNEFGEEIKKGGVALGGFGSGATKALSGLRTLAYILPGIGIAGIFNLAFEAIGKAVSGLDLFAKKIDEVKQSQLALIKVQQEGQANAQKEIVSLDVLYRATQNQNLSMADRVKAVNILQEKYPSFLKNISDEDILAGRAANAYIRLKDAIITKAVAQSKEDEIAKRAIENDKLKFRNDVIQVAIDRLKAQQAKSEAITKGDQSIEGQQSALYINSQFQEKILGLEKEREQNGQKISRNLSTQDLLFAQIEHSIEKSGVNMLGLKGATQQTTKAAEQLHEVLAPLGRAAGVNGQKNLFGQETVQIASALGEKFQHLGTITKQVGKEIQGSLTEPIFYFSNYLSQTLIPQFESNFNNFFSRILETGKFSFKALGDAILNTFTSILASEATQGLLGLLGATDKDGNRKSSGLIKGIGGLLGGGGAGILGTILPIAGIAAGALAIGSSLFGHKNRNQSAPVSANPMPVSAGGGSTQVVMVQAVLRGRDLVMALNLEGYYLSRVQQNGRRI